MAALTSLRQNFCVVGNFFRLFSQLHWTTFNAMPLEKRLVDRLHDLNITTPTEIQQKVRRMVSNHVDIKRRITTCFFKILTLEDRKRALKIKKKDIFNFFEELIFFTLRLCTNVCFYVFHYTYLSIYIFIYIYMLLNILVFVLII